MRINIHAGHNPEGKVACGARGILDESREDRIIKNKVIQLLRAAGHEVFDCTVDDGVSQGDVLRRIVEKSNSHDSDLDVSIHLNSGRNDYVGDGSIGSTEVFVFNISEKNKIAFHHGKAIVKRLEILASASVTMLSRIISRQIRSCMCLEIRKHLQSW